MRRFHPHPRSRVRATSRHAFSLVELAVVVAILGVLSAATFAALAPSTLVRQRAAAKSMATMLNRQRAQAMLTGVGTWVTFNTSTNSYAFSVDSTAIAGRANASAQTDPDRGGAWTISLGSAESAGVALTSISIGGGGLDLGYDWMGRPINSGGTLLTTDTIITLSGPTTVTVRAGTGLASTP